MRENWDCFPSDLFILNIALAIIDGLLAITAFAQLIRIHMRDQQRGWTRQKVLHLMVGFYNLGYFLYFVSALIASCKGWCCWSHACGFILMAFPKILFLTVFLLLLSFWVDLCHQANDEEEDDDMNGIQQSLLCGSENISDSAHMDSHRKCCSFQGIHIGSRQKIVILIGALIFVVMMAFAVVIWIGIGRNPINQLTVAEVYENFLAVTMLILAAALGYYSLLLHFRLKKVRSENTSSEMWKVASLGVVSVVCFSSSALVALFTDIPLFYHQHLKIEYGTKALVYLILYFFIGSSLPSASLLWIMRDMPPPIKIHRQEESRAFTFVSHETSNANQPRRWAIATSSKNQGLKPSPI